MPGGDFHPSVQYYTYVRSQAHPLSDKADRFCFGLKVQLRLKPPEESPAYEIANRAESCSPERRRVQTGRQELNERPFHEVL